MFPRATTESWPVGPQGIEVGCLRWRRRTDYPLLAEDPKAIRGEVTGDDDWKELGGD